MGRKRKFDAPPGKFSKPEFDPAPLDAQVQQLERELARTRSALDAARGALQVVGRVINPFVNRERSTTLQPSRRVIESTTKFNTR